MKRLCCSKRFLGGALIVCCMSLAMGQDQSRLMNSQQPKAKSKPLSRVIFYYGKHVPVDILRAYQVAVVEPDSGFQPKKFQGKTTLFAYVSLGEVNKASPSYKKIRQSWVKAKNKAWNSVVMDETNPAWRAFAVNNIIGPLWREGYHNFFFDTLDSYHLISKNPTVLKQQQQGLISLIRNIHKKYPKAKFIFNRGFEIVPSLKKDIYALAAESVYKGYNATQRRYVNVTKSDRQWLVKQLNIVKALGIPVIAIDYLPTRQTQAAINDARNITKLGFIPWVSDGALNEVGVGNIIIQPRTVIVIYDDHFTTQKLEADAFRFLAMPLEFLGYKPDFIKAGDHLPSYPLVHRVAGVIGWFDAQTAPHYLRMKKWLRQQNINHIPIVFMDHLGMPQENSFLSKLGFRFSGEATTGRIKIIKKTKLMGFESPIYPVQNDFDIMHVNSGNAQLVLSDQAGKKSVPVAITQWGGYALAPYIMRLLPNKRDRWLINPFEFLRLALHDTLPIVPDPTTLNGRRIMFAHIDGDAFISKAEWYGGPYAAKVIEDKILDKYRIPTAVSIVEGELAPNNLKKARAENWIKLSRSIFAKPWVEIATHGYSHPFDWIEVLNKKTGHKYRLSIKNYNFSLKREITGSVNFINKYLAPKGKYCNLMLWTGKANPTQAALAVVYHDGLLNMNGGSTEISNTHSSMSNVSGLGIWQGPYFQVFAPIMNENIYTNLWKGPFWGFRRVIETLKLTESPRRLKPIDIYYHFYSGTKHAALNALRTVYDWSLRQHVINLFPSDYIREALNFNTVVEAISLQGAPRVFAATHIKEYRVDFSHEYPSIAKSKNIIGYNDFGHYRYIHLGPKNQATFSWQQQKPSLPYVSSANGQIVRFQRQGRCTSISLRGYMPLKITLGNTRNCKVSLSDHVLTGVSNTNNSLISYTLGVKDAPSLRICC